MGDTIFTSSTLARNKRRTHPQRHSRPAKAAAAEEARPAQGVAGLRGVGAGTWPSVMFACVSARFRRHVAVSLPVSAELEIGPMQRSRSVQKEGFREEPEKSSRC